ncbi:hypothetical protein GE061_008623 [Apolygus lucorum]|uniref:Uncharacterized protein n=1 Tax=Apolygus lucorum TaxID=248454 RepID=A0A8S9WLA0_APOLU|nr:hypothetical protein GE061_008623 [Apolygus lucorum]
MNVQPRAAGLVLSGEPEGAVGEDDSTPSQPDRGSRLQVPQAGIDLHLSYSNRRFSQIHRDPTTSESATVVPAKRVINFYFVQKKTVIK